MKTLRTSRSRLHAADRRDGVISHCSEKMKMGFFFSLRCNLVLTLVSQLIEAETRAHWAAEEGEEEGEYNLQFFNDRKELLF